jgi:hypothetical protein
MTPHAANERFHEITWWEVDRSTSFIKARYLRADGTFDYYDKSERSAIPHDIYVQLFPDVSANISEDSSNDNPLDEATDIPHRVYELLPPMYKRLCGLYATVHERHVFLCGTLATTASLLSRIKGYHADGLYTPDLFFALVASAGQGKGTAAKAFDLAFPVDEMLRYLSEAARLDYEARKSALEKGDSLTEPEPAERCHIVPANASSIALIQALHDNGGRAYLAETEIDSMLAADRNAEWGNVSSILRGAFHHETVSVKRKTAYRGKTTLTIKNPCLSVFLSGTPSQFQELMHSTENGLFSRFAVYYHNPPLDWRSHRPTVQSTGRASAIEVEAQILKTLYEVLAQRNNDYPPVLVELSGLQWDMIDNTFSTMQREFFYEEERPDSLPSARRGAIVAFRLAMQFAVIRWTDAHGLEAFKALCNTENAVIHATDDDVRCAFLLAQAFTNHAHKLSSLLPKTTKVSGGVKPSVMRFLELLPRTFETKDALTLATANGIAHRTAGRYLKSLVDSGHVIQIVTGRYVVPPTMPTGTRGISGITGITDINEVKTMPTMPVMPLMPTANNAETAISTMPTMPVMPLMPTANSGIPVVDDAEVAILLKKIANHEPPDFENCITDFSRATHNNHFKNRYV